MGKIRIGVLGPADIAKRRMVPAMMKNESCEYIGVALATEAEHGLSENGTASGSSEISERTRKKGEDFVSEFGGRVFEGYEAMLASDAIDAVEKQIVESAKEAVKESVKKTFKDYCADLLEKISEFFGEITSLWKK